MRRTVILAILALSIAFAARAQTPNTISTVAGGGANAATATSAYLSGPFGVARDGANHVTYLSVSSLSTVYKVDAAGNISPYAGKGVLGFSGDGGAATSAELNGPNGIAVDAGGNLFIADSQNNRIRRVDFATHVITTVAGSGNQYNGTGFFGGYSGDGGPASSALMNFPVAVAVDGNGNLFIADSGNNVIRKVDNSPTHVITTFAGNGTPGTAGTANGDGGAATAAQLSFPEGVAVDSTGNVFIGDSGDSVVRRVDTSATPIITTYAGSAAHVFTFSGDGGPANQAGLNNPEGVSADSAGNLYIADTFNNRIRKVDNTPAHNISTFAGSANICLVTTGCGDGAAATSALLNSPTSVAVDGANGNVFLCDSGTQRYRMVVPGATPTINAYAGGGAGGDGSAATSAVIGGPPFVTVDSSGDLLVVDSAGARIRKVNANTQVITNFAGNGVIGPPGPTNGDGGPATQANLTQINHGIAMGPSGDVYFVDRTNSIVRRIDTAGTITRVAGSYGQRCAGASLPACGDGGAATSALLRAPTGIAVDSNENIYISDAGLNRIRVFAVGGNISNFAGTGTAGSANGAASSATFNGNWGIAFDANSNLFVADTNNNLIRKIDNTAQHNVTTYAFNGQPTFGGDGGTALSASMQSPQQVAVDGAGNVYVGGGFDNVVRRIDVNDQSVITVAGDVHNLDGGFRASDDGGPSTKALISNFGLAIFRDTTNNTNILYIADQGNNRIRKVDLAPAAQLTPPPPSLPDFGPVLQGAFGVPQIITIMNNGLDDLTVTSVTASSGFGVTNECVVIGTVTPQSVPPGGSCLLVAQFGPVSSTGPISGTISFKTNNPNSSSFSYSVSGTGVATASAATLAVSVTGTGMVDGEFGGIACPTTCTANFAPGQQVTLVALPTTNSASTLTGWTVNGSPSAACPATSLTCLVTMGATGTTTTVAATFGQVTVTVSGMGNGSGTITSNPAGISCTVTNGTASGTCSFNPPAGTQTVTLTACASGATGCPVVAGGSTSTFAGWLGFCGVLGITGTGTGPCTLNLDLALVPALNGTLATAVFSGPAKPFTSGQVFVGTVDGMIFVYNPDGSLAQVLNSGGLGGIVAGMNFDKTGNLYAANVNASTVERFVGGTATPTTFGSGINSEPIGVLIDAFGNVFVGEGAGKKLLLEFSSAGTLTNTFFPAFDVGGIGYLELLDDSARVLYTSSTQTGTGLGSVRNYDIANNHQNPDFATNLPGGPAYAIRELSDRSIIVANSTQITHLDPNGNVLATPSLTPPAGGIFFALNINPDGKSFWTGDAISGKVYQVDISTGNVLNTISTGLGFKANIIFDTIFGIAVFGQPPSGGADVAVTMTAPTADIVGTQITYTATVTNNGPLTAAGVTATDTFPAGVTVNAATSTQGTCTTGQAPSCNIGAMNSGANVTVTFKVTPTLATTLDDTVTVNATTPDPNPGNNSFTTATTVTGGATPATITMSAPSSLQLGASLIYSIVVTNPGATTLTSLVVTDPLPGSLSATSLSPGCTGTTSITCTIASLAAGQAVNLSITIVPTSLGTLTNTGANVTGGGTTGSVSTNVINNGVPLAVEVDSANSADFITTNPSSGICTQAQAVCTSYFPSGTVVTVTANGPGFIGWNVNNAISPSCPATSNTCTVTLSSPQLVIAGYSSIGLLSSQLPTGVVGIPYGADLSQGVVGGVAPYTITLTGTLPNGLTFTAPSVSGIPTATGATPLTVNITDSIGEKGSVPETLTIISAPTGLEALVNGNYGILLHMVNDADGSLLAVVGSLHFNGKGVINSGTLDTNGTGTGVAPQTISVTGTYTIGPDHRGLIKLQNAATAATVAIMAMSVGDVYQGVAHTARIIEFSDNTGTGFRGAGIVKLQDPKAFNAASFAGPYIFAGTGQNSTLGRLIEEGLFAVTSTSTSTGNFGSGSADVNDNGTLATVASITGTYSEPGLMVPIDPGTGRTQWNLNGGTTAASSYIIDANNVVFITMNTAASSGLVIAGPAERQLNTTPFDATFLSGPDVIAKQGPSNAGKNSDVFIGVATFTAAAGPNPTTGTVVVAKDVNAGGIVTLEGSENNTYTMAPTGRFVTTIPGNANQPIGYLSRPNHGYTMDTVADPQFGSIDLQTGGPFTVPALATDYFFGGREPSSTKRGEDVSGVTSISNNTLSATFDQSHEGGRLDYADSASFGISVAPAGRLVFTNNRSNFATTSNEIGQVITPSHAVFAEIDPTQSRPTIHETQSFTMPAGVPSPNPAIAAFPTAVTIGSNATMTLTFTNASDGLLSFTGITNATDFSATGGTCIAGLPVVVLAHSTCAAIITFAPQTGTATGVTLNETVTLVTDAGPVSINASGMASGGQTDTLTVTITGTGSVKSTSVPTIANEINCANPTPPSVCSATFNVGTSVSLTATPGTGQMFNGWTAGPCISSVTNPCNFVISATTPNPTASFLVIATTLTSIAVTPLSPVIAAGQKQQFTATGTFTSGPTQDITTTVTWSSSLPGVATISNTAGSQGSATAVANGTTLIEATLSGVTGAAALTVAPGVGLVPTGNLNTKRSLQTATLLNDGTVLVVGGAGGTGFVTLASAETYNPNTGLFTATGNMNSARLRASATLLPNGMVLVAGGTDASGNPLATAELYNPANGTFALTGSMTTSRAGQSAILLPNGKILIAGGFTVIPPATTPTFLSSAELYDPATGIFTATGSMTFTFGGTITLLNTGKVLIVGGPSAVLSADLYDPAAGTFAASTGAVNVPAGATATLLNSGMVLFTGGLSGGNATPSAELYNPATDTFTTTGSLVTGRFNHTATLLSNGMVLVAAGYVGNNASIFIAIPSAELYDPAAGTFTETVSLNVARDDPTATLLNIGKILITGGDNADQSFNVSSGDALASSELFTPSTFTPPGLTLITVTPANPTIAVGSFQRFVATGTFTSGPAQTLASVTWLSSNTGVASITNDVGSKGFADASPGTTTITARAGTVNGSTLLTVVGPTTHFLVTAPATATAGTPISFTVTAQDAANNTVTTYPGTVNFSSTDGAAMLPASDVGLTNGVGNFQATLNTTGSQTITVKDSVTASIFGSTSVTVTGTGADLAITISAPANVAVNTALTYTIVFTNNGPQDATNVAMSDGVPGGLTPPASGYPAGCGRAFNVGFSQWFVLCNLATLANGASVTVTYPVTPTATGTLSNTATVSASQTDPNPNNNSSTVNTTVGTSAPVPVNVGILNNNTSGGTVVDNSTPPLINCFTNGQGNQSGTCHASYAVGAVVTFKETPNAGAAFTSWNGPCQSGTGGATTTCTITVTNPMGSITATYTNGPGTPTLTTALPTNLTASTGNGRVSVGPTLGGINCTFTGPATPTGACSVTEKSGQIIQLIPQTTDTNSTFGGWAGTCVTQVGNDCFVTMNGNQTLTPVFSIVPVTVNVTVTGVGSVVDNLTPPKINCMNTNATTPLVCSATYNSGTSLTFTESPGTGYLFTPPFNGCTTASATTCTLNLNAQSSVTDNVGATFTINSFLLTVSDTGGSGLGSVKSNPNNLGGAIACGTNNQPPCGLEELFGWAVVLTATPSGATTTFTGWSSSAVTGFTFPCTTTSTTCAFNMPAGGLKVTAAFSTAASPSTVQVSIQGNGTVTSTSNPTIANEIDCAFPGPPSVCMATFASGTQVSLIPAPPGAGEVFSSWTAGPCVGTKANPCVFTVSNGQPVNATASFAPIGTPTFTSTTLPTGAVTVPYGADIQVTGGTQPYTFAVATGSSMPTGFTLDSIASGNVQAGHVWANNPATSGNLSFMVTVTDSSSPTPQSVTGTITIPISPTPPNTQASLLNGRYAMLSHGFRDVDGSPEADTGSLLFDGLGGLTGVVDMNNSAGVQQEVPVTGTYTIGPDNRGTLVLTVAQGSFHGTISVGDVYRGIASTVRITQFNNNNGTDRIGSGILRLQDTTAFNPTPFSGTYVFSASGVTPSLGRAAYAGLLTFDAANNLTGGTVDANDAGTLSNVPSLTGTYTGPDLNGHVVFSGLINDVPFKYGLYQISANEFFILSLTLQSGGNDVVAGSGLRQSSLVTFGAGSLTGPDVVSLGGASNNGTFAAAGIFTANPTAAPTPTFSITADTNDGGTLKLGTVVAGTYSVGLNGRAMLTPTSGSSSNPAFVYLARPDRGFFLIGDASAGSGPLVPQVGAPFSTTPFTSNLFFGQQEAITGGHSEFSGIGVLGAGNSLTITDDESHLGGDLFFDQTAGTFTPTITGAGHITLQNAAQGTSSGYLISPFEFAFIDQNGPASDPAPSARPHIVVAHTIPAAPGTPSPAAPTVTFPTPVASGSNQSMSLTITNTGLGPLGFTGVNAANSPDFSASGTCISDVVVVVQVQGTCTLTITFAPTTGTQSGVPLTETLIVQTDGTSNITVTEKGTAAATLDFSLSATPASQSVKAGASTSYSVNVAALGGFSASVALSATGQPSGTTATFNPTAITPGVPSTLTVTTASNTPLGTSTLTITGTGGGLTHTTQVQLTVTPTLVSIAVAPTTASIAVGKTQQFTATGTFSDKSTQDLTTTVTWASSNTTAATIVSGGTGAGTATGIKAGTSTITASLSGVTSNGATLTVTGPTLVSIAVTPANPTVVVGQTQQFTATGTFSDKSTQDLTASVVWASSNTEAATITAGGLATGVTGGETSTISATVTQSEISGSTLLTVTTVPFVLAVTPPAGGSGSPATVTPGGSVAIGLTLTATPGFTGTVTFSCVSNQPQFLTCTPAPGSVTLSGNKAKNVAIVLNTFCSGIPTYGPGPGGFGGGLALLLATAMLGSVTWAYRRRSRWALSFAVLMLMALGSSACNSLPKGTAGATPPGNYILNITATAGTASQTIQVPITVLP